MSQIFNCTGTYFLNEFRYVLNKVQKIATYTFQVQKIIWIT